MSLVNFSDNFVSHVFVQLVDLKQLEFFSTDRPTDRQTNLLIEAPFRSLKKGNLSQAKLMLRLNLAWQFETGWSMVFVGMSSLHCQQAPYLGIR